MLRIRVRSRVFRNAWRWLDKNYLVQIEDSNPGFQQRNPESWPRKFLCLKIPLSFLADSWYKKLVKFSKFFLCKNGLVRFRYIRHIQTQYIFPWKKLNNTVVNSRCSPLMLIINFFCLLLFEATLKVHLHHFSKKKKSKRSHKTVGIKVFLTGSWSLPLTNGSGSRRPKNIGTDPQHSLQPSLLL